MADWFKFYENDLDETRLQYAISKLPEVVSVWVGILSEACRHKSGTVRWGENEIELFGFSRRLNVSIPKVNEAVNLLCQIDYVQKEGNTLIVLKWNKKQSEYCQSLSKKQGEQPELLPSNSGQPRENVGLEERRGEETRKEELASKCLEIYQAYPRKVSKPAALKAIEKALTKIDFETLKTRTQAYAVARRGQDPSFTPHPATWFNGERFNDDPSTWKPQQFGSTITPSRSGSFITQIGSGNL